MRLVRIFQALVVVTTLSACGSSEQPASQIPEVPPADAIDTYSLPLDPFILTPVEILMIDYAENLQVSDCMSESGYAWVPPRRQVDSLTLLPFRSLSGRILFDERTAAERGYHVPDLLDEESQLAEFAWAESLTLSDEGYRTLDTCIASSRETLSAFSGDGVPTYQRAAEFANQALADSLADEKVVAAASLWRECMVPLGIADLPQAPDAELGMPTQTMREQFQLGDQFSQPTSAEIRIALFDAECRQSSGYRQALFEAEWSAQRALLTKHADELVSLRGLSDELVAQARHIITENAG